jgi:histidinol-phosphatase (PHP family)
MSTKRYGLCKRNGSSSIHVTYIGKIFVRQPLSQYLAIPNKNMPFSHHSHSGQFCGHAANTLEEVVQAAIAKGMTTFCMTEHMPRELADFYPEEVNEHDEASLSKLYDDFYVEARRLQKAYASQIQLFVGFEGEWIRPGSLRLCENILEKHDVDLFIGSVHHVYTVPIDFDLPLYHKARDMGDGTDERIAADYFDSQHEMLQALKPPVVAHFDLIRLKSDDPERSFRLWPQVWEKIERNLQFIAKYGGVLELNSSSLRKGMSEPYPQVEICKVSP